MGWGREERNASNVGSAFGMYVFFEKYHPRLFWGGDFAREVKKQQQKASPTIRVLRTNVEPPDDRPVARE